MKAYYRTEYSDLFTDALKSDKGINLALNNAFIIKNLIKDNLDVNIAWLNFESILKDLKLRLTMFAIGYNKELEKYHIRYVIESKIHNNRPIQFDRMFKANVGFAFVPSAFPDWLMDTLNDLPTTELALVSNGG